MTHNDIILELYQYHIPERMASKFADRFANMQDRYDYVQEMYIILLEMSHNKLQELSARGELPTYFAQVCINQVINHRSKFNKKYETFIVKSRIKHVTQESEDIE